jgi:acetyl esterase
MVKSSLTKVDITKSEVVNILKNSPLFTDGKVLGTASASESGLDVHAQEVLNFIHSLPPVYELDLNTVRNHRLNPFEHDIASDVSKKDITIPCKSHEIAARVYRPTHTEAQTLPALIYFHGGGFVLGDIESYDKMLAQLCRKSQIIIISIAYRLAPETIFPGAVEDAQESTDWIAKNADALNINAKRIAIGGDSAGANLATGYCLLNKARKDFKPFFQLLIYPSIIGNDTSESRQLFSENLLLTKNVIQWFHQQYIADEQADDPRFNLMKFNDFSDVPSTFVMTCGFDPLRDEGELYATKLTASGIPVRHSCYTDMFHGFINFGKLQQARDAINECAMILQGVMNLKEK